MVGEKVVTKVDQLVGSWAEVTAAMTAAMRVDERAAVRVGKLVHK